MPILDSHINIKYTNPTYTKLFDPELGILEYTTLDAPRISKKEAHQFVWGKTLGYRYIYI